MDLVKLIALDNEDLTIISAHVQDAVVRVSDLNWLAQEGRFVMALRRFDWQAPQTPRRRLSALHFGRVQNVSSRDVPRTSADQVLNLLALTFTPADAPAGTIVVSFSGGAALRLDVECIEAQLADLGPAWEASGLPRHNFEEPTS
jgi:hypothetical protein